MIAVKDGGPAFPASEGEAHQIAYAEMMASGAATSEEKDAVYMAAKAAALRGMSIRDHFAGLAMQGLMTAYWETFDSYENSHELVKCQVETAYEYADAMLKQRSLTND